MLDIATIIYLVNVYMHAALFYVTLLLTLKLEREFLLTKFDITCLFNNHSVSSSAHLIAWSQLEGGQKGDVPQLVGGAN